MDFSLIGQKIKELRKQAGLSQGELAKGICTQAQISKIERGDVYPYASTLYLISQRLGVDVNYFFDLGMTPRLDYVQEVKNQLTIARWNMNYTEMEEIVETEENNPLFKQNKRNYQLLLWHKGIYEYTIYKKAQKAMDTLKGAILLTQSTDKIYSEREIEILLSIGSIYFEEKMYKKAFVTYKTCNDYLSMLPYLTEGTVKTHIYYNMARALTRSNQYRESNTFCEEAIKWCIHKSSLYLLGELHYHIGYNFELTSDFSSAKEYMEKAKMIFELQNEKRYIPFIEKKLKKWGYKTK
ncbi:XRE family transcriptional regulator [Peribacillus cavernae]|uniref:XRE family transcriptional regulator n=1 Tax=Peribacillus cavernae TaxID=1674310 RepID=A0A3S0U0E0_9BACI|nr:helix-turn-helix domain-containing protein [Peribacillus cavernae]MDQ0218463.1 transcriptional regulator with XRE-family HTH domain [Peribacillus cavernae]RUQ31461.1 XRE family transcriptional regulator [Peribacillus cavernae]